MILLSFPFLARLIGVLMTSATENGMKDLDGVGLIYCSHNPQIIFSNDKSAHSTIKGYLEENDIQCSFYCISVWGHFDTVGLLYSNSTEALLDIAKKSPGIGPGIDNYKVTLGNVFDTDKSFRSCLDGSNLPLKAVCSFKCNKNFIVRPQENSGHRRNVQDYFDDFKRICHKEKESIKDRLKKDLIVEIIIPYSWTDFIVIIQSNSFESIKEFVLAMRRSIFETPRKGKRHLFFYSDTAIGIPYPSDYNIQHHISTLSGQIENEKIDWNINFRIRPGHSFSVVKDLERIQSTLNFKPQTFIGGYDLTISPKTATSVPVFIDWFYSQLHEIAKDNSASILKSKTNFFLPISEGYDTKSSKTLPNKFLLRERALRIQNDVKDYFPNHIISSLVNVASSFDMLVNQHETIKSEFKIVTNSFLYFLGYFQTDLKAYAKALKGHDDWIDLMENTWNVLSEFSHILSERFREGHLCGDNHFETPSVTYSGSFQKNLQAIENFVMKIILNSGCQIQNHCHPDDIYHPIHQAICSIKNSESPSNTAYFNNAFIHLPLDSLVFQECWFYIIHETGHIIQHELQTLLIDKDKDSSLAIKHAPESFKDMLDELFADAFTTKLLFMNDRKKYSTLLFDFYIKEFNKWDIPEYRIRARMNILDTWIRNDDPDKFGVLDENGLRDIVDSMKDPDDKEGFKDCYKGFSKLIQRDSIKDWFIALKKLDHTKFEASVSKHLDQLKKIVDYAYEVYDMKTANDPETHSNMKALRKEIISDLWYDSVAFDYVEYFDFFFSTK